MFLSISLKEIDRVISKNNINWFKLFLVFQPLPKFDRIPGVRLSGKAFADCLMIVEFVHNFASILGFGNLSLTLL